MSDKGKTEKPERGNLLVSEWLESLTTEGVLGWETLPDIGLYMDQVLTLVDRQLSVYSGGDDARILTSAMVNNYIKDGLLPRAKAKKYTQEHLAILLMIATLKQVMSIRDIRRLLAGEEDPEKVRAFFNRFSGIPGCILHRYPGTDPEARASGRG